MSHFSVLVIGNDVEKQLQPYHEFECTGTDDEYIVELEQIDELREEYEPNEEQTFLEFVKDYTCYEVVGAENLVVVGEDDQLKYGYIKCDENGEVISVVRRTNPSKKWDWWELGGRWSGFFRAKEEVIDSEDTIKKGRAGLMGCQKDPAGVDQALKSQIDFAAMRSIAGNDARYEWNKVAKILESEDLLHTWTSWSEARDYLHKGNIELAREFYNNQPAVKLLKKELDIWGSPDHFLTPLEDYVQEAVDSVCVPYAVVMDGEWYAKGEMGWFGMSDDELSQDDWNRKVNELIDSLPDDTLMTIVDCHI